ncbi:MAG: hypothetical protein JSR82_16790 [Verrucomicrobia bacterium]|nr:hypothetical protein [Verrucomicrobiota bacterium]
MKRLVFPALFVVSFAWLAPLSAQERAEAASRQAAQNRVFDLNGDGKITDDEVDAVVRWELLNPEYKLSRKERKALEKRRAEEKKAEITKWDLNGDGKLDAAENKRRLEAYERLARAQKKSKEQSELEKPMMGYMGK